MRDARAVGAQLIFFDMRAGGIRSAEVSVRTDRPVVAALVRSTVPAEVRAVVAEPEAVAAWKSNDLPILGSYRILATQSGWGQGGFAVTDATKLARYDAVLVAPIDAKSDAPYSLAVNVRQYPGENPISRGEHGQCYQERRPPLPTSLVPVDQFLSAQRPSP